MATELYKRYRPKSLKGVVGQEAAVGSISKMLERGALPHALLLTGPSGCGKTTIARILCKHVGASEEDTVELNTADWKGIDMVRDIRKTMGLSPMLGDSRVWIIDEAHKMTPDAQNAFLKPLEDTPEHVFFMLATTDPMKLLKTVRTRCTEVKLGPVARPALNKLLNRVCKKEQVQLEEEVRDAVLEAADSSARKALVVLDQIIGLETVEEQVAAARTSMEAQEAAINLARALIRPKPSWQEVSKVLEGLQDEDPEGMRYLVLGYCKKVLLGGGKLAGRAATVMQFFRDNFYDSKMAGVVLASYEATLAE